MVAAPPATRPPSQRPPCCPQVQTHAKEDSSVARGSWGASPNDVIQNFGQVTDAGAERQDFNGPRSADTLARTPSGGRKYRFCRVHKKHNHIPKSSPHLARRFLQNSSWLIPFALCQLFFAQIKIGFGKLVLPNTDVGTACSSEEFFLRNPIQQKVTKGFWPLVRRSPANIL